MARERATDTHALLLAAARAFESRGYHRATIDDIAMAAGISRPTVYKYTKSKQQLLDLMVAEFTSELGRRTDEVLASKDPAAVRLRALVEGHVDATIAHRTFYSIVFSEEAELSAPTREAFRSWAHEQTKRTSQLLAECLDDVPGQNIDPTIAANLLESMLATLYRWFDPEGPVSPEALVDQILTLVGSLTAPAPRGD